jgi:hypothetical protein
MKKVLGIVALMMVMAVSALAVVSDSATVPVYLNVPEFVRLSVHPEDDGQFDLYFDPADPDSTVEDTVSLLAEANVNYNVNFESINPVGNYGDLTNLISVSLDTTIDSNFGNPGNANLRATAVFDTQGYFELDNPVVLEESSQIAEVIFTISAQ